MSLLAEWTEFTIRLPQGIKIKPTEETQSVAPCRGMSRQLQPAEIGALSTTALRLQIALTVAATVRAIRKRNCKGKRSLKIIGPAISHRPVQRQLSLSRWPRAHLIAVALAPLRLAAARRGPFLAGFVVGDLAADDLSVERDGLQNDIEAAAVFVGKDQAEVQPEVVLPLAPDDRVGAVRRLLGLVPVLRHRRLLSSVGEALREQAAGDARPRRPLALGSARWIVGELRHTVRLAGEWSRRRDLAPLEFHKQWHIGW